MNALLAAIVENNRAVVAALLDAEPDLVNRLIDEPRLYEVGIFHWTYVGDTALHLAAAGYRVEIVRALLAVGADSNATANRRRSGPLHYAADGHVGGPAWNPEAQVQTICLLLDAGARINASDMNGATPLHRAVRTRCAAAVLRLLSAGADPLARNKAGSTPFHLAVQNTGRGGSGDEMARNEQRRIVETFLAHGLSLDLEDGSGKSVLRCVQATWLRTFLEERGG